MKIGNVAEENLHIFRTTLGKCLMIILIVTKKQGFTPSLEIIILEKPHPHQFDPSPTFLVLKNFSNAK